jgi:hypothetical protein
MNIMTRFAGQHDAGHGEHEERQRTEEARLGVVVLHVAEREDVHQHADEGHDEHHAAALLVDQRVDARLNCPMSMKGSNCSGVIVRRQEEHAGDETNDRGTDGDQDGGTFQLRDAPAG